MHAPSRKLNGSRNRNRNRKKGLKWMREFRFYKGRTKVQ